MQGCSSGAQAPSWLWGQDGDECPSPAVSPCCPLRRGRPRGPAAPPRLKLVLPGSCIPCKPALAPAAVSSPPQTSLTRGVTSLPSHLEAFPGQGSPREEQQRALRLVEELGVHAQPVRRVLSLLCRHPGPALSGFAWVDWIN